MAVDHLDDLSDLDGMRVGGGATIATGEIGPFSSVKLDIVWQPTIPGKVDVDFCVSFTDPDSEMVRKLFRNEFFDFEKILLFPLVSFV